MALYPALHISGIDEELVLAAADDWTPVAAEPSSDGLTVYFGSEEDRDAAAHGVAAACPDAVITSRDVDDEDWARRSQENLGPIVVGRITVRPGDSERLETAGTQEPGAPGPVEIVIQPSMGFGTGHHATTRLCLAALQRFELRARSALDVGTGSGVLALAARALGASQALGIDCDPDAIQSARENLPLNPRLDAVRFEPRDLTRDPLPEADVVTANLTGALLCRAAPLLIQVVRQGGTLILSGVLDTERNAVVDAFSALALAGEAHEGEWVVLRFDRGGAKTV